MLYCKKEAINEIRAAESAYIHMRQNDEFTDEEV